MLHLPLRYEDETALTPVDAAPAGKPVLVEAPVKRAQIAFRPKRQLVVHAENLVLRFFNFYGSQLKQFQRAAETGRLVRAFGEVRAGWFGAEMAHPRYRIVDPGEPLPQALTPIYPTTAGLSQGELRALVLEAVDAETLGDTLPAALRSRLQLADFADSVRLLHRPQPGIDLEAAWRRVKFDELLAQQLSMRFAYRKRRARRAPIIKLNQPLLQSFLEALPFRFTKAQTRAMHQVLGDLGEPHPMQRLLQGDVGSGKTVVAAVACLAAVDSGLQAAVMAPTEILSEQHWLKFNEWLAPLGVRLGYLRGSMRKKEKAEMLKGRVLIGTHALIQKDVEFSRLGLVIVDEQHRFGVEQRLALRKKAGAVVPHQLMMSATPIPRTLEMTYYADLDVSTIDELPPGRRPVRTRMFSEEKRGEVLRRIREACAEGQQAYWVCPVIEESKAGLQTALATFEKLSRELSGLSVALLHGRLPVAQKGEIMQSFKDNRVQLLVCTTVIEVGVDVPNASLMVIESAERFGLAQLHQLRGRVGRGTRESFCLLLYKPPLGEAARQRLDMMEATEDGFLIAEKDLELCGGGEVLGARQSGVPEFRIAAVPNFEELLGAARDDARLVLAQDPHLTSARGEALRLLLYLFECDEAVRLFRAA